jgi:Bacterial transglutaminase-like N-terminal region
MSYADHVYAANETYQYDAASPPASVPRSAHGGYILLSILNVRHTTVYRYRRPVALGDHRLMLRPRDSHDLRLIQTNLNLSPPATLRWNHDVFGNSIAIASFAEPSAELRIEKQSPTGDICCGAAGLPDHSGGSELSLHLFCR